MKSTEVPNAWRKCGILVMLMVDVTKVASHCDEMELYRFGMFF